MNEITWNEFEKVELRAGTITQVEAFPEAHKAAYKLVIDLGDLGAKRSSAQITEHYTPAELMGMQVLCVCNFPAKQIGPFISEVLVTGLADAQGSIVLASINHPVPNGTRLC